MGTISVVPCEEQSREKVTAIEALVAWALVSLPGVGQRFGNNNFRTAVPGPPAPTPRGAPPKTQIRLARDDGTRPSPGVAASTIKIHPSALASVTIERSAEENAHSPSIQQALVRNSDAPEVDEQPLGARGGGDYCSREKRGVQLVGPEAHVETTGQADSSVQPRERAMRWRVWRQTGRLLGASIKRPTK
jgi:hypothetical protein